MDFTDHLKTYSLASSRRYYLMKQPLLNFIFISYVQIPKEGMKFTHPALAITVATEVAALQDVPVGTVLKAVAMNTFRMYGVEPKLQ